MRLRVRRPFGERKLSVVSVRPAVARWIEPERLDELHHAAARRPPGRPGRVYVIEGCDEMQARYAFRLERPDQLVIEF